MKFTAVYILSLLSFFQSGTLAACEAKAIVDRCVADQSIALNNCSPSDSQCQCNGHTAVLACYQNCPNDELINGQATLRKSQITIYCNAASQTVSSSSSSSASASGSSNAKASAKGGVISSAGINNSTGPTSDSLHSYPNIFLFATVVGAISFF